jgi:hypothetical protein
MDRGSVHASWVPSPLGGEEAMARLVEEPWSSQRRKEVESRMPRTKLYGLAASLVLLGVLPALPGASAYEVVLSTQGEYVDGYLVNGKPFPPRVIVDDPDPHPPDSLTGPPFIGGRHLNGQICFFPPRVHRPHQYIVADDTYRESCVDTNAPQARCAVTDPLNPFFIGTDPDGWGIFDRKGRWTREHIHTPWDFSQSPPQGNMDPQGCAFDRWCSSPGRIEATRASASWTRPLPTPACQRSITRATSTSRSRRLGA